MALPPGLVHALKRGNKKDVLGTPVAVLETALESSTGNTALHIAIQFHHNLLARKLLRIPGLRTHLTARNLKGQTCLAVAIDAHNLKFCHYLLTTVPEALDYLAVDIVGQNLFHYAATRQLPYSSVALLQRAAANQGANCAQLLGTPTTREGDTPLHVGVAFLPIASGSSDNADALIDHRTRRRCSQRKEAGLCRNLLPLLALAEATMHPEAFTALLGYRNLKGETPLDRAIRLGNDRAAQILLGRTPEAALPSNLLVSASVQNMHRLLDCCFNATFDEQRGPPKSSESRALAAVCRAVQANLNQVQTPRNETVAHLAAIWAYHKVLELFLWQSNLDIAHKDIENNTVLHLACAPPHCAGDRMQFSGPPSEVPAPAVAPNAGRGDAKKPGKAAADNHATPSTGLTLTTPKASAPEAIVTLLLDYLEVRKILSHGTLASRKCMRLSKRRLLRSFAPVVANAGSLSCWALLETAVLNAQNLHGQTLLHALILQTRTHYKHKSGKSPHGRVNSDAAYDFTSSFSASKSRSGVGFAQDGYTSRGSADNKMSRLRVFDEKFSCFCVARFLRLGGNPDLQDNTGHTALMLAARKHLLYVVKTLRRVGNASTVLRNHAGHSALDIVVEAQMRFPHQFPRLQALCRYLNSPRGK